MQSTRKPPWRWCRAALTVLLLSARIRGKRQSRADLPAPGKDGRDSLPVQSRTCWLALRASGAKLGEGLSPYAKNKPSPSLAHTASIYITLENSPPLSAQRRVKLVALAWAERLKELEKHLASDRLPEIANAPGPGRVDLDCLRKNQEALVRRVQKAKKRFEELSR